VIACLHCGEPEHVELLEVWGHEFQIETCCAGMHEDVCAEMAENPDYAKELLRDLGAEEVIGSDLRRVPASDGQIILDFKLEVRQIAQGVAKDFVRQHHEHCKPPAGWRYGAGIWNGVVLMGVVMVGRPVARLLDHTKIVEANRVCVRRDTPPALRWNACSQLYGWSARQAEARGFEKIITYTLESEEATTLRAAGWTCEGPAGGGSWDRVVRRRGDAAPTGRKVRWSRMLSPRRRQVRMVVAA
jgi:hypothetical protein